MLRTVKASAAQLATPIGALFISVGTTVDDQLADN
jgi:hypothetical protein